MFQFRQKTTVKSESTKLQKEARRFQEAMKVINNQYKSSDISMDLLTGQASKSNIDVGLLQESFDVYLRNNAVAKIRAIKQNGGDYTVLNLEQAAQDYGFEMDDLNVTYFSEE